MNRVSLEAQDPFLDDAVDAQHTRPIRRAAALRVMILGLIALGFTAGGVWLQQSMADEEPVVTYDSIRHEALMHRKRVLIHLHDPPKGAAETPPANHPFQDERNATLLEDRFVVWSVTPRSSEWAELRTKYELTDTPAFVVTTPNGIVLNDALGEPLRAEGHVDADGLHDFLFRAVDSTTPGRRRRF